MFRLTWVVSVVGLLVLVCPPLLAAEPGLDATTRTVVMSAFPPEREVLLA